MELRLAFTSYYSEICCMYWCMDQCACSDMISSNPALHEMCFTPQQQQQPQHFSPLVHRIRFEEAQVLANKDNERDMCKFIP